MTAVEALRMARVTLECRDSGVFDGCAAALAVFEQHLVPGGPESRLAEHDACASALLDGFSVEEVTAAEHATDQPHE